MSEERMIRVPIENTHIVEGARFIKSLIVPKTWDEMDVAPPKDWRPCCYLPVEITHGYTGCAGRNHYQFEGETHIPGPCKMCPYLKRD